MYVAGPGKGRDLDDVRVLRQRTHQIQGGTCGDDQDRRIGRLFADGLHDIQASTVVTEPVCVVRKRGNT